MKCLQVCFYRDCRASNKITIGKADATGVTVSDTIALETYWEHPEFIKADGSPDGSW